MQVVMPQKKPVLLTSTDWLKLVGITAFLIDHAGLFFIENDDWWRMAGRIAAPIFFFLIGFARSRNIPLSWLLWGVALTLMDWWIDGGQDFTLNILLNFAFVRLALRGIDRWASQPWQLALVALIAILLLPWADTIFEYGAEGWLWALFGYTQRLWRHGDMAYAYRRIMFAGVAALFYVVAESAEHQFENFEALALAFITLALAIALLGFDRTVRTVQPPSFLAKPLVWISHYSLAIYAISLFLMQDVFYVFPW